MTPKAEQGRRLLALGLVLLGTGLALATTSGAAAGSFVLLAGWGALVFGLHLYGRAGAPP